MNFDVRFTYSDKELELFRAVGASEEMITILRPNEMYAALTYNAFMANLAGPAADSLRRCEEARLNLKPTRRSEEFDALIQLEPEPPSPKEDGVIYDYSFYLHPDETWGRTAMGDGHARIPQAVFKLFDMLKYRVVMEFTPLDFVRFRHDVESFGVTLREISRVPHHEEESVL